LPREKIATITTIIAAIVVVYVWLPIMVLMVMSFKQDASISFPIGRMSLVWYVALLKDTFMMKALLRSVQLGLATMIVTTLLCLTTALGLRKSFPGRNTVFYLVILGMIIPGVVYGIGASIFFGSWVNVTLSMWTVLPIQVVWTLPFGIILMLARFDPALLLYEQAAAAHGASPFKVLREVTLPLILPQLMAAALFAFTLSLGELMRSLFLGSLSHPVLPLLIYGTFASRPMTPEYFSLGTVIACISIALVLGATVLVTRGPNKEIW
jgi:putative spermidine/putrescine transport system permease protein